MGVKASRQGGKNGAHHEDVDLVFLGIDSRTPGRDLIMAQGGHRPADTRTDEIQGEKQNSQGNTPEKVVHPPVRVENKSSDSQMRNSREPGGPPVNRSS